jgi:hypothetical protein
VYFCEIVKTVPSSLPVSNSGMTELDQGNYTFVHRTRDCKRLELHLFCQTQPSIETSSELKFACLQTSYPQMKEQFKAAKLSPWNNEWFNIHDFNSASGRHFSFLVNHT